VAQQEGWNHGMSDLKQRNDETITIRGETYNLVYNMNVVDAIVDKFGSLKGMEEWERAEGRTEKEALDVSVWLITQIINEDIFERNENGENLKLYTPERLKRELSVFRFKEIKQKLRAVATRDMPEVETKN
jgi:P2-related tail formation protein